MTGHGIEKCACGNVIRQCRCWDCPKTTVVVSEKCSECKARTGTPMQSETQADRVLPTKEER